MVWDTVWRSAAAEPVLVDPAKEAAAEEEAEEDEEEEGKSVLMLCEICQERSDH